MITHACIQGSPEWHKLRLGIPTASRMGEILTPLGKVKTGKGPDSYIAELAGEYLFGASLTDDRAISHMERGNELEPHAAANFEWEVMPAIGLDLPVTEVGFVTLDDGRMGASPDRLVGDDGLLEIKCPMAKNYTKYMIDPALMMADYATQVHAQLFVTDRAWCYLLSYNPKFGSVYVKVDRDQKWDKAIKTALYGTSDKPGFFLRLGAARERINNHKEAREAVLADNPFA